MRSYGTYAIGIRTPIIFEGDDLVKIVVDSILIYLNENNVKLNNYDIIGITEAVVARSQGNYATIDQIGLDVKSKIPVDESLGIVFPILSRNRFSILLKGIALGVKKLYIQLSYPSDEVGNHLVSREDLYEKGINPYSKIFSEEEFRTLFGEIKHQFTGVDYLKLYKELGNNATIILANDPKEILKYTKNVICADIHTRNETKRILKKAGANIVLGLDDLLTKPVDKSGYNKDYGLLGSNKASEERVKLFPHDCEEFILKVQNLLLIKTGIKVEVLVYGDGAFKDPVGKIWELADPVVSPAYTSGLVGLPNELKLKYIADNELSNLKGKQAIDAMVSKIKAKNRNLMGKDESEGTTPRRLSDLIGSLCDLMSGSGDKGTPIILIKGYFDNFASE